MALKWYQHKPGYYREESLEMALKCYQDVLNRGPYRYQETLKTTKPIPWDYLPLANIDIIKIEKTFCQAVV